MRARRRVPDGGKGADAVIYASHDSLSSRLAFIQARGRPGTVAAQLCVGAHRSRRRSSMIDHPASAPGSDSAGGRSAGHHAVSLAVGLQVGEDRDPPCGGPARRRDRPAPAPGADAPAFSPAPSAVPDRRTDEPPLLPTTVSTPFSMARNLVRQRGHGQVRHGVARFAAQHVG